MENFLDELPQNVKEIAKGLNINAPEEIIITPNSKLFIKGCTEEDIKILKEAAAKIVARESVTAADLLKQPVSLKWSRISFGCAAIDRVTKGGVATRGITEICGGSGVGKTQLLLQLSLMVQLPRELGGLEKGVAFICTEDVFPTKRLFELSKVFEQRFPTQKINYLRNVHIEHMYECDELLECVSERLNKLMSSTAIGLIVVDSVAAAFRLRSDYVERARDMRKLANSLLKYADKYIAAVVCVNQVATSNETPCLGLAWAYLGRTRIKLSKVPKQITYKDRSGLKKEMLVARKFEIQYSPDTPNECAEFLISTNGVMDVPTTLENKFETSST